MDIFFENSLKRASDKWVEDCWNDINLRYPTISPECRDFLMRLRMDKWKLSFRETLHKRFSTKRIET